MSVIDAHPSHPRRWRILVVLCLSLLLVVIGNTVINVALPTLVDELDATATELQWIVDAYPLVFGGTLLTMGALGDRFGRRGALQLGLVVYAGASIAGMLATSAAHVIATRAVMGLGAALVMPATLSILIDVFPPGERGKAMGIWAGFAGIGGILGPTTSGWLLEHFAWQSVFLINVPVALLGIALAALMVPTSRDPDESPLDPVGATLSMVALMALLFGIIEGPAEGWTSALVLGAFAVGVVASIAFVAWELRVDAPMLDLRLFRRRGFAAGSFVIALSFFALFATMFQMTQYLQFVRGYTPFEAGVRFLPFALGLMLAAPNSHRAVRALGQGTTVATGLGVVAAALLAFSLVRVDTPFWAVGAAFASAGFGMGLAMAPSTTAIMADVPSGKAGVGSAMNDVSREVGGALGIAVFGSIHNSRYAGLMAERLPEQMPSALRSIAEDSIGGAIAVAARAHEPLGDAVRSIARDSFVDAMGFAFVLGALVALLTAFASSRMFPREEAARRLPAARGTTLALAILLVASAVPLGSVVAANDGIAGEDAFLLTPPEAQAPPSGALDDVALPLDSDGDGIDDENETALTNTDPLVRDTDGDGLTDGEEMDRGTDPRVADSDGDGVGDGAEAASGTDPRAADTDADGFLDGEERGCTSPLEPDSDADGLLDGSEADFEGDPCVADTDGDGLVDGAEVERGTRVAVTDSDADHYGDGKEVSCGSDPTDGASVPLPTCALPDDLDR